MATDTCPPVIAAQINYLLSHSPLSIKASLEIPIHPLVAEIFTKGILINLVWEFTFLLLETEGILLVSATVYVRVRLLSAD